MFQRIGSVSKKVAAVIAVLLTFSILWCDVSHSGEKSRPSKGQKKTPKGEKGKTTKKKAQKKKKGEGKRTPIKADVFESAKIKKLKQKLVELEKEYTAARETLMKELEAKEKEAQKAYDEARKKAFEAFRKRDTKAREAAMAAEAKARANINAIRMFRSRIRFRNIYRPKPRPRKIPAHERLGIRVNPPSNAMMAQLGLKKGTGLVVYYVGAKSSAEKAGFQKHDLVLEVDGKTVSNDVRKFHKILEDIKTGKKFDATVLRGGKKQAIEGVVIPKQREQSTRVRSGERRSHTFRLKRSGRGGNAIVAASVRSSKKNKE